MPDLLLELRSEEIPARMQAAGAESLRRAVEKRLQAQKLSWSEAEAYATPRRLALIVRGLPDGVPAGEEELRGPRVSASEKALAGFLRSTSLTREALTVRGEGVNAAWFAIRQIPPRPLDEVLINILSEAVRAVRWPKSMRWGCGNFRWVRPLRGILCILSDGTRSRPVALDIEGIPCGVVTRGHPYLAPDEFIVKSVDSYESDLKNAQVILRFEDRRRSIFSGAVEKTQAKDLELVEDSALLDEIAGLVEWPVVVVGRIEEAFSDLPDEVLQVSMRKHQKFFSLRNPESQRIIGFAGVADIEAGDDGAQIRGGYERVLRARLKDALFFWENDQRTGLEAMRGGLSGMMFHTALGNMEKRTQRIAELAVKIAPDFGVMPYLARHAGELAKADICSETVREFPELQGIVGGLLAHEHNKTQKKEDKIPKEVVVAIAGQYRTENNPVHFSYGLLGKKGFREGQLREFDVKAGGDLNRTAAVLILADRIDTLWGFFAAGERPTSSRDPYALRRSALMVLRTLMENEHSVSLQYLLDLAEQGYEEYGDMPSAAREDASYSLREFMLERLRVDLRDGGSGYGNYRHDMIAASILPGRTEDNPVQIKKRTAALNRLFVERLDLDLSKQADAMLAAWRRCASILDAADKPEDGEAPDHKLYCEPAEHSLAVALKQAQGVDGHGLNDPVIALGKLKELYESVGPFFEKVHVNDSNSAIRQNRFRLLAQVRATLEKVADFGAIEG